MENLINTSLGQYQLIEMVRRGGMATIYKAYQESLDRYVAVKVLLDTNDPQFAARFKREARAIAQLQHPNILPIYDYGEQGGLLYLVLQYIENGATLGDLLGQPMPVDRALRLMSKVLAGLEYAHDRGIIHRDIKPANILMSAPNWPMLADFGIAKLRDDQQRLTMPGLVIGTAAYMAPEQASGLAIDARTDLYSIGVVLYELLTGQVPFEAPTPIALLSKHAYEPPPPPRSLVPDLPVEVEQLLLRVLAKDPASRHQTAAELAEECERAALRVERGRTMSQHIVLYEAGVRAFEAGRVDEAVTQLQQAVALAPDDPDAAALLAMAREAQQRNRAEAQQLLQQVRSRGTTQQTPAPAAPAEPARASGATRSLAQEPAPTLDDRRPAAAPEGRRSRVPLIAGAALLVLIVAGALLLLRPGARPAGDANPTSPATSQPVAEATPAEPAEATPAEPAAEATPAEPVAEATVAPQPTAELPPPAGQVVFADDFGAGIEKSGLAGKGLPADLATGVDEQGAYTMQLSSAGLSRWALLPRVAAGDFSLQIDLADGSPDRTGAAGLGVVFRARDNAHFYALLIDPRRQTYAVRRQDGADTSTDLIAEKQSALIRQQDAVNQLRLDAKGDAFTIYLNGAPLDSFSDGTYATGMIGTVVATGDATGALMRFDNLQIHSDDAAPAAPQLPATRQDISGDMVLVPGGEFIMGSNDDPAAPPQMVDLPDFYIDRKEVTNVAYLTCADSRGCSLAKSSDSATHKGYDTAEEFLFYPVLNVSWEQARFFCEQSNKRLPTEAEWEKAASWLGASRAKSIWPWGDSFDQSRLNSAEAGRGDTVAVGTFRDEENGTFDMAGNAAEWTSSLFKPYPYDPGDGREDPKAAGPRVVRGGSWAQPQQEAAAYARQSVDPATIGNTVGFRCAASS